MYITINNTTIYVHPDHFFLNDNNFNSFEIQCKGEYRFNKIGSCFSFENELIKFKAVLMEKYISYSSGFYCAYVFKRIDELILCY